MYNLLEHEAYDSSNPNSVYALIGGFIFGNPLNIHSNDGKGHTCTFLGEQVKFLDEKIHPSKTNYGFQRIRCYFTKIKFIKWNI